MFPPAEMFPHAEMFRAEMSPDAEMFRAAAEKGIASAQIRLARCLAQGAGVQTNMVDAAKWHLIAKSGGLNDEGLEKMLGKLSKADRSKAEKAAADWRDRAQIGMQQ